MLKLVANPTFKAKVEIPMAGGEVLPITFEFKHRTKSESDALLADPAWPTTPDVENVMKLAVGWEDEDTPFNEESLKVLFENHQAAPLAIMKRYFAELAPARLGN